MRVVFKKMFVIDEKDLNRFLSTLNEIYHENFKKFIIDQVEKFDEDDVKLIELLNKDEMIKDLSLKDIHIKMFILMKLIEHSDKDVFGNSFFKFRYKINIWILDGKCYIIPECTDFFIDGIYEKYKDKVQDTTVTFGCSNNSLESLDESPVQLTGKKTFKLVYEIEKMIDVMSKTKIFEEDEHNGLLSYFICNFWKVPDLSIYKEKFK